MRIRVAKRDLDAAMQVVNPSLGGAAGADPMAGHYLFRDHTDDGKGEVLTSSGPVYAGCPFVAEVDADDEDGASNAFSIEGRRLRMLLGAIPDEVVSFEYDDKTKKVEVGTIGGPKQTFASLNPEDFPYWDPRFKEAEKKAVVPAHRLSAALSYAKRFASTEENRTPQHCVCEIQGGRMAATDQRSAAVVEMPLLGEAAFRIHIKHVSTVLSFLNGMGTDDVAVHTHDRCVFFVRADGALLGESRPLVQFPKFKTPKGKDQRYWVLGAAEVRNAVAFLQAGAAEEDIRLLFTRPEKDGPVVLSMLNLTGTRTQYPLTCAEAGEVDDVAPFPDSGFVVARDPFLSLLDAAEGDFVRLGVNLKPKKNTGGYLRHMVERFGADGEDEADSAKADTYVTVLPWLR